MDQHVIELRALKAYTLAAEKMPITMKMNFEYIARVESVLVYTLTGRNYKVRAEIKNLNNLKKNQLTIELKVLCLRILRSLRQAADETVPSVGSAIKGKGWLSDVQRCLPIVINDTYVEPVRM